MIVCTQAVDHNKSFEDSLRVTAHALVVLHIIIVIIVVVIVVVMVVVLDVVVLGDGIVMHVPSWHRTRVGLSGRVGVLRTACWKEDRGALLVVMRLLELRLRLRLRVGRRK